MAASRVGLLSARLRAAGPGMLWSVHQPSLTAGCSRPCIRNFSNYHRILQMITFGIVTRVRPLHLLVATGGGYVGYYQYHKYKRRELEHCGLDELVKESLAPAWQVSHPPRHPGRVLVTGGSGGGPRFRCR